ncbi:MAG: hypothetical protein FWC78_01830 [Defluviitaleaceae bacterium]|nr:hypothetical protein [Defluviitaleaceae bacterium]
MKKYVLSLTLAAVMLLAFAACNRNGSQETAANTSPTPNATEANQPPQTTTAYARHQFRNLGFSIEFPSFWGGKFGVATRVGELDGETAHFAGVYHIATRAELYALSGFEYGGGLLTLGRIAGEQFADVAPGDSIFLPQPGVSILLAQTGGYIYFANFPSGVEYNADDPSSEAAAEYLEMIGHWEPGHWDFLASSFMLLNSVDTGIFATALADYFAGSAEGSPFGFDTWAGVVDIDGDGTLGVLAIRHDLPDGFPVQVARVFYESSGEVAYMDIENYEDFPQVLMTAEGRLVQNVAFGRWMWSFTLFGLENGRLTPTLTIFVDSYEETTEGGQNYYTYPGGWQAGFENANQITQDEFDGLVARYGLYNFVSPSWAEDETQRILW